MKKTFTKLFSTGLLMCLTLIGFTVKAQTTSLTDNGTAVAPATASTAAPATDVKTEKKKDATAAAETKTTEKPADADTTWKPQRRLWGYAFGDLYWDQHSDKAGRGAESNYAGVPTGRNAFQFRRVYLGYDYDITKRFKAEVLLSSEPTANTGVNGTTSIQNGDNLVDNKMGFFIKNFNLRYRDFWTGSDLVVGELSTPGFALNEAGTNAPTTLSENVWAYRSVERTITDFHKNNSYDLGAALQGTFDPATKNFGYVAMVANNSTSSLLAASNPNTGFYKMFYGDIWSKFLDGKLVADFYADYAKTAPTGPTIGPQEHNMYKLFAAYTVPTFTFGVEAYTQNLANAVTNTTTKLGEDATVHAISLFVRGAIVPTKIGFFARFDDYNPDTKYNSSDTYTVNTNYGSYTPVVKEKFYTAGLDFTPAKNIHFMPNLWLLDFKDARDATAAGYAPADHTLVYRMTFFYVFGK